jgi:hypothetical protein
MSHLIGIQSLYFIKTVVSRIPTVDRELPGTITGHENITARLIRAYKTRIARQLGFCNKAKVAVWSNPDTRKLRTVSKSDEEQFSRWMQRHGSRTPGYRKINALRWHPSVKGITCYTIIIP